MALTVTHAKTSGIADSGDPSLVQPSDWNAGHVVSGSAGTPFQASIQTGRYYTSNLSRLFFSAATTDTWAGKLVAIPFIVQQAVTWTRIGIRCDTGSAGIKGRLGIYSPGSDGFPDARLLDAGEIDFTTPADLELTISQALSADTIYWLAGCFQTSATADAGAASIQEHLSANFYGITDSFGTVAQCLSRAHAYGALPATFGAATIESALAIPGIYLRKT